MSKDFAQGRLPARLLLSLAYMAKVVADGEWGKELDTTSTSYVYSCGLSCVLLLLCAEAILAYLYD